MDYLAGTLAFTGVTYLVDMYVDWRQHRCFKVRDLPSELKGVVSEEKFERSQRYNLDKSLFSFVRSTFDVAHTATLLTTGALPAFWDLAGRVAVRSLGLASPMAQSLVFVGGFFVYSSIVALPFSWVSTFVVEAYHGMNRSTQATFWSDKAKGLLVELGLMLPITYGALRIIEVGGQNFWLYLWGALAAFQLVLITVYPIVIAPLFNKFVPLEDGNLRAEIEALAGRLAFPLSKIFVTDGSKRSSKANAYFMGLWEKRIVLFDTLLERLDDRGTLAVLAHELGHWKLMHTWGLLAVAQAQMFGQLYVLQFFLNEPALYSSFGFSTQPALIGIVLFSMVFEPLSHVMGIASTQLTRSFEYAADRFAVDLGFPTELPAALEKIHAENLGIMIPDPVYAALNFSHPSLLERKRAIAAHAKKAD